MKFRIFSLFILSLSLVPVFSQLQDNLTKADELFDTEAYQPCKDLLLNSLPQAVSNQEKAEVQWRLARVTLFLGDLAQEKRTVQQALLKYYEEGEQYAQQALLLTPNNHLTYFWKASNIGRWGQVKGILNALGKAQPMQELLQQAVTLEPEHGDSYYVLGQLYVQVPGWPISFGNKAFGISFSRKAAEILQKEFQSGLVKRYKYDYYTELAKGLYERDWSVNKRQNEQAKMKHSYTNIQDINIKDVFEKNFYFEGTVALKNISDREEAKQLVQSVVQEMESIPVAERNREQRNDLQEAREFLAKITK